MPFTIPSVNRAHPLNHQNTSLHISNRPMLHASRHLEHIAHVQLHRMIDADLLRVLRRGRFGRDLEPDGPARDTVEDFVGAWVGVPNERAFDFGDLEGVGGVYGHEMFGLPVVFDAVDSVGEVDWFHSCGVVTAWSDGRR